MADEVRHDFIKTHGIKLHVASMGDPGSPPVILLHGFPEHWRSWRKQLPALAEAGYYAVAPDMRGYNLSDKPTGVEAYRLSELTADVAGLIRALGKDRAVVAGHDWGGAVAWAFAADFPKMLDRLIILNAPHPAAMMRELRTLDQVRRSWYMFYFQLPWLPEASIRRDITSFAYRAFRGTAVRKQAFSDEDIHEMIEALSQPGALTGGINYYRAIFRHPFDETLAHARTIQAPTLVIWGLEDFALRKELTYGLEKWVPDLAVHYVPHCGHWVQNEAPEEVNRAMLEFLEREPEPVLPGREELSAPRLQDLPGPGPST